ncbi:MAG: anaerobic ribonucleoside-triphosphate reductase activating protein [Prevotella sp.]|nr:anaerobic ribonucleoside-triphosphate reductase activating protein [Prevotella sp.]
MLKYLNTGIVFQEIPDETTLAINITQCPCHCPGCHSTYLWEDIGDVLDRKAVDNFVNQYGHDITCICLMGGDSDPAAVNETAAYIRHAYPYYKVGWYSGRLRLSPEIEPENFDYIKIGPYIRHLGPLKSPTTNQRLYQIDRHGQFHDITFRFWQSPLTE